jgi:UDP-N-acetylmuramoylalanine--D-glutamate ligase
MSLRKSEFADKRIAVVGIARTGLAAAPVLKRLGARVTLSDSLSAEELAGRYREAQALGVDLRAGVAPESVVGDADILVPSPGIKPGSPIIQQALERGIPILSEIEVAYRVAEAPILAVTGTNGKTTTTILLGEMMRAAGKKTFVAGNVAADDIKLPLIAAAGEAESEDVIVAEISSFQLMWVEKFRPRVGVLTNITPDHMNWHQNFQEYVNAKGRLFAQQRTEDVAIVNRVNAPARAIGERVRSRLFWFDRGHCMGDDSACVRGGRILARWGGAEYDMGPVEDFKLPGRHNLENALAAAGAAIAFGIDSEAVRDALREFRGVVHRMELVAEVGGVQFINNSMCTNVDAAVRSLEAMSRPTVVIAGGASKNTNFEQMGAAIALYAKGLVLIGEAADAIEDAARSAGFDRITRAGSLEDAVRKAAGLVDTGEAVMLSPGCASFDMFSDFQARGDAFRQAVRAL